MDLPQLFGQNVRALHLSKGMSSPEQMAFDAGMKKANSTGLQLADLVARPIGLHALHPEQPNRAFESLKPKITLLKTFP